MKSKFLLIFLVLGLLLPLSEAHFFEEHSLETLVACELVEGNNAIATCRDNLETLIACNEAADWSVLFYFIEDGKFYRFTHSRQYYNELLTIAGSNSKLRACAVGVGLHANQDVNSHGHEGEDGYTGETLKRWFISNTIGHPAVERNMINYIFANVDTINYKGRDIPITATLKERAEFYKKNGLTIFASDEELLNFIIEGSGEITGKTIRDSIAAVSTAVIGGKQESAFSNFSIPAWWWITAITFFSIGLIFMVLYAFAFFITKKLYIKIFIAGWVFIFFIVFLIGLFGWMGLSNGKAFVYYENVVDFAAGFLKPTHVEEWMEKGITNSVNFMETGIHPYADASGWNELGGANSKSFFGILIMAIAWILSSLFILNEVRKS